jgi:hypothetical protein
MESTCYAIFTAKLKESAPEEGTIGNSYSGKKRYHLETFSQKMSRSNDNLLSIQFNRSY